MERPGEALERLHAVRRLLQQCNAAACAQHGLTQTEAAVLLYLHNNPGRDSASDIVAYRSLPKANVSKAVDALVRRGLLLRETDGADRRRVHLHLTRTAQQAVPALVRAQERFFSLLFTGFTDGERAMYAAMNARIAANAKREFQENAKRKCRE